MARMTAPPIDVLPLLAREEQALIGVLADLGAQDWTAPTEAGWPVHDLTAHVLGTKLGRLSRDRDGHVPEAALGFGAEWVTALRQLSPEVLFAMFVDSTTQLTDLWKHRDLEESDGWLTVARDYAEHWVHQQQIRAAVGAPPLDDAEFRTPVVDTLLRPLPHALPSARPGRQVACTVEGAGRWTIRATPTGWSIERGAASSRSPLASMTTDADAFWRLCTGTLAPAETAARVQVSGDPAVCEVLLGLRSRDCSLTSAGVPASATAGSAHRR
nr:maleylpyruvate isomerase family mycothiol-dependent enzyme [Amycolatopsis jejuensis]